MTSVAESALGMVGVVRVKGKILRSSTVACEPVALPLSEFQIRYVSTADSA